MMRRLRWREVKPCRLTAIDANTGPGYVLLAEEERKLFDSLSGKWLFPRENRGEALTGNALYWFWLKVRNLTGIVADARLPDLRHVHASHAVMNGERLHITGRLLGHRRASTINRYVHLDNATAGPSR